MNTIYLLAGGDNEYELAAAEAVALSAGRALSHKIVEGERRIDINRTAYVAAGLELLADGPTVEEACRELAAQRIAADAFGIEVLRVPGKLDISRRQTADAFARVIEGHPNLDQPKDRFLAIAIADHIWFGRALPSGSPDWRQYIKKPHDFSSALPAQAARAICNLFIRGGESVIDPCCGTGTFLIQAAALGARIRGSDINPKMVSATNHNLEHFGFPRAAEPADATQVRGSFDVMLTNIPYGNMSRISVQKAREIIANVIQLAPRGVIVAAEDVSEPIASTGADVRVIRLHKFSMTRFILAYERPPR